ncbi:hypothetical protein HMPREF9554_01988 [Treponema phagedenis F0421]|nr:hypothetical protein HMPREF9554_01988 [Treponema phagedenis F0421]
MTVLQNKNCFLLINGILNSASLRTYSQTAIVERCLKQKTLMFRFRF